MFKPLVTKRPDGRSYFELVTAKGPSSIGTVGDGTFQSVFGYDWLMLVDRATNKLKILQWSGLDWLEQLLPGALDFSITPSMSHFTFAFDQAAQIVLCYQDDASIKLWRYTGSGYAQDVSFAGLDPCLMMDALVLQKTGDTDVHLFYVNAARSQIYSRTQRFNFANETLLNVGALVAPVILDRVQAKVNRWQILMTENGVIPESFPTSAPYPLRLELATLTGNATFEALVRSIVQSYKADQPTLTGNATFEALVRSIVQSYEADQPTLTGNAQFIGLVESIAKTYTSDMRVLQGNGTFLGVVSTIGKRYTTDMRVLQGDANFSAVLA